jgi:hypothetical protein
MRLFSYNWGILRISAQDVYFVYSARLCDELYHLVFSSRSGKLLVAFQGHVVPHMKKDDSYSGRGCLPSNSLGDGSSTIPDPAPC